MKDMAFKLIEETNKEFIRRFNEFIFGTDLYNWKWFLTAFVFALIIYSFRLKSIKLTFIRSFKYVSSQRFKAEFFKDVKFFFLKIIYKPLFLIFLGFNVYKFSNSIELGIKSANINLPILIYLDEFYGPLLKMFFVMLSYDFASYIVHYFQHKIKPLWVFHKTHHRATSLNPLTRQRNHPVTFLIVNIMQLSIALPLIFLTTSIYSIPNDKPAYVYLLVAMIIKQGLDHLRHSHVKIHFGILSYIFLSPAMHQVHHSISKKHHDKNLGLLFSFWDLMFGTFYLPQKNEIFKVGVPDYKNLIPSMTEELILPFKDLYEDYGPKSKKNQKLSQENLDLAPLKPNALKEKVS